MQSLTIMTEAFEPGVNVSRNRKKKKPVASTFIDVSYNRTQGHDSGGAYTN